MSFYLLPDVHDYPQLLLQHDKVFLKEVHHLYIQRVLTVMIQQHHYQIQQYLHSLLQYDKTSVLYHFLLNLFSMKILVLMQ